MKMTPRMETPRESDVAIALQAFAAFLMALGPGIAEAFYLSMIGYYLQKFGSPRLWMMMLVCVVAPKPLVVLFQSSTEAWFCTYFTTQVAYAVRVIAMQLGLAGSVLFWALSTESQRNVLLTGWLLGVVGGVIVSSALQMVAAANPTHVIYTKAGLQIGGLLPVIALPLAGFTPDSSRVTFQSLGMCVAGICLWSSIVLFYLHHETDIFATAYRRLSYDLQVNAVADGEANEAGCSRETFVRQETDTKALDPSAEKHGVPAWVFYWQCCTFAMMSIAFFFASLSGFCGDAMLAQQLALLKLTSEFCGRIFGFAIPWMPNFETGPGHQVMIMSMLTVLGMSGVCLLVILGVSISFGSFIAAWVILFAVGIFANAQCDVTTGAYVAVRDRKSVARTNQMVIVAGQLFGIFVSLCASDRINCWQVLIAPEMSESW